MMSYGSGPVCHICGFASSEVIKNLTDIPLTEHVKCPKCGSYKITGEAYEQIESLSDDLKMLLSAWIRERTLGERSVPWIVSDQYVKKPDEEGRFSVSEVIAASRLKNVGERLDRILLNLASLSVDPGQRVELTENDKYLCLSKSMQQVSYFMKALEANDWVEWRPGPRPTVLLKAEGWNRVAELQTTARTSEQVFVAMAYTDDLEEAWRGGFQPSIVDAGLRPLRLDKREHNEKICDLIIVEITRSRVLVADVTHHRQGVYFEAGYAMGLRIPVIWTCRDDDKAGCHFDTRQYNHIFWKDTDDLRIRLNRRVQATIL